MNSFEQARKFIENLCQTMQNEQRTEKQIEMEGFIKEWNNQRRWLLTQVNDHHHHFPSPSIFAIVDQSHQTFGKK